jgi:hypothetical protein
MRTTTRTASGKAMQLLADKRVQVMTATEGLVIARVAGDHDLYVVRWDRGQWHCECPGGRFGSRCSHVRAVSSVTMRPPTKEYPIDQKMR